MRGEPFPRALKALQQAGGRDIKRLRRIGMRKAREHNDQNSLAKFQRQGSDGANDRFAAALNGSLVPRLVAFLERQSPDAPAIKLDETRVGPDSTPQADTLRVLYRRDTGLTNEFIHQAGRRRVVEHEPLVTRQGYPKAPQAVRIVGPFSICRHRWSDPEH
jgi:hypothetical protein